MTYPRAFLDEAKIVEALAPAADAAGRNGDWISLKGCAKCSVVVMMTQGNAATVALTIEQAKTVAGGSSKALANAVPISSNLDTAAGETMTKRTAAVSYTTDAGLKNKIVVFDIDPAQLDINNGFDCIRVSTGASNAANITAAFYVLQGQRFPGAAATVD